MNIRNFFFAKGLCKVVSSIFHERVGDRAQKKMKNKISNKNIMSSKTCQVCANNVSKFVKCSCNFECCVKCTKRYLMESFEDSSCMSCHRVWDHKFLVSNISNMFANITYKNHKKDMLYQRELAKMQSTQPHVEKLIEIDKITLRRNQMYTEIHSMNRQIYVLKNNDVKRQKFVKKCPSSECNGFLNSKFHCALCDKTFCSKCYLVKNEDHTCDQNDIDTIKLITDASKPCPKCSELIIRNKGCNHMWCSWCKTSFNWESLQIISDSKNSNPHYREFLRTQGTLPREPGDILCGREIDGSFENAFALKFPGFFKNTKKIFDQLSHIRLHTIPSLRPVEIDVFFDDRVKFMRKLISEDKFKQRIQKRDRKLSQQKDLLNLYTMYVDSITDILYRMMNMNVKLEYTEIYNLRTYVGQQLDILNKTYKIGPTSKTFNLKINLMEYR